MNPACEMCRFFRAVSGYDRWYCTYPYYAMFGPGCEPPTEHTLDCNVWYVWDMRCNANYCTPNGNWFAPKEDA